MEEGEGPDHVRAFTLRTLCPVVSKTTGFLFMGMPAASHDETRFMRRALRLAERGRGRVSPNPIVGAVVVRGGRIVGEGWHRALGESHAESMALRRAGARARGATMYVSLEPCAHLGRTPPCVEAIVAAGIRKCCVAVRDPNRIVNGRGLRRLRAAGVRVNVGLCAGEARQALGGYWLAHTRGWPRVTLKLAASLDGRIAPAGGLSATGSGRWITGSAARREAHRVRAASDAVVIGAGTARTDDPRLTARGVGAPRQPLRVVCDTRLSLPLGLRLFSPGLARGTVVACGRSAPARRQAALEARGVRVWRLRESREGVSPRALLARFAGEGCCEIVVEGGSRLAAAWTRAGVVDRIALFVAPRLLGSGGLAWGSGPHGGWRGRIVEHGSLGRDVYCIVEAGR